jgi:hypothetical protein
MKRYFVAFELAVLIVLAVVGLRRSFAAVTGSTEQWNVTSIGSSPAPLYRAASIGSSPVPLPPKPVASIGSSPVPLPPKQVAAASQSGS